MVFQIRNMISKLNPSAAEENEGQMHRGKLRREVHRRGDLEPEN